MNNKKKSIQTNIAMYPIPFPVLVYLLVKKCKIYKVNRSYLPKQIRIKVL